MFENLTREEALALLTMSKNNYISKYVIHNKNVMSDPDVQIAALHKNFIGFDALDNPSERACLSAVKREHDAISKIKNPSEKLMLASVKSNPWSIQYIDNPPREVWKLALERKSEVIDVIQNVTDEMIDFYCKDLTFGYLDELIKAVGYNRINEQNILTRLSRRGCDLQFVKNPTEEMIMTALECDGDSLQYVNNPTEEMKLTAVKTTGCAIDLIDNPTEEMMMEAVKEHYGAIEHIDNPPEKVQMLAVTKNCGVIDKIDKPTEKVMRYVAKNADVSSKVYSWNGTELYQACKAMKFAYAPEDIMLTIMERSEDGKEIEFFYNPSEKVQVASLRKNSENMKLLWAPTKKVELAHKMDKMVV